MFTVEIRVNGALIAHIYGRNTKQADNGNYHYTYEYYETESRALSSGNVIHRRRDGMRNLVSLILQDVDKTKS